MAHKIHLRMTVIGTSVCASRPATSGTTKIRKNSRASYASIPTDCVVSPEEFRATAQQDRCCHCSDRFLETMNNRRKLVGKPLYSNVWLKVLA